MLYNKNNINNFFIISYPRYMIQSNILRKPVGSLTQSVDSSKIIIQSEYGREEYIKKTIHAYKDKHKYVDETNNLIKLSQR
jgi:hypothetical protein